MIICISLGLFLVSPSYSSVFFLLHACLAGRDIPGGNHFGWEEKGSQLEERTAAVYSTVRHPWGSLSNNMGV